MKDKKIFSEEKQSKLVLHTSIEKVTFKDLNMLFFFQDSVHMKEKVDNSHFDRSKYPY